jgi:hypothetical protein
MYTAFSSVSFCHEATNGFPLSFGPPYGVIYFEATRGVFDGSPGYCSSMFLPPSFCRYFPVFHLPALQAFRMALPLEKR